MISFFIPLIVVLIIYVNIYRTARTAVDTRSSIQMSQFLSSGNSPRNTRPTTTPLTQQQSNGNDCASPQLLLNSFSSNTNDENPSTTDSKRTVKYADENPSELK